MHFCVQLRFQLLVLKKFKEAKIFNNVDFNELVRALELLKSDIPSALAPFEENMEFAKRAQQIWIDAFKVNFELVSFSLKDLNLLNNYLKSMIVIIHCQRSSLSYSQSIWDGIESRILVANK
ncbi:NACHT C-terminal helical domain 2-containing protein [Acaryochloris sp. 'Moss Beach']|uniref:NACHT C-terminal helical domain 2-containing protein n=1 Tax=Acaryochloris sp. 'Moss Beach' TaxID=2740837 RepID=UPI0037BE9E9E